MNQDTDTGSPMAYRHDPRPMHTETPTAESSAGSRVRWLCSLLFLASSLLWGCATPSGHPEPVAADSRIGGMEASKTVFVLKKTYTAGVMGSEYILPYGLYSPEGQDKNGIYYKAPIPLRKRGLFGGLLSLRRESLVEGGIYVPFYKEKPSFLSSIYLYVRQKDDSIRYTVMPSNFETGYGKHWFIETRSDEKERSHSSEDRTEGSL